MNYFQGQTKRHHARFSRQKSGMLNRYTLLPLLITAALYSNHSFAALSAVTSQTIKGNAPELSTALQTEITSNTFSLLHLVAKDSSGGKTTYTSDTDPNFIAKVNGINQIGQASLDKIAAAFANDTTGTLTGGFSTPPASDAIDIDGDGNFALAGTTTADWYYDNTSGTPVKISPTTLTVCDLYEAGLTPYIQVSASNVKLRTQYGDPPDSNSYGNTTVKYTIPTPPSPFPCFAKANINWSHGMNEGPASEHNRNYGFLPQDINTPSSNFPTTGSNALAFYLTVVGATVSDVIASSTGLSQGNIDVVLSPDDRSPARTDVVKVTLTGPKDGNTGNAAKVQLPAVFKLTAPVAGGGTKVIYSFAISKWFIARPGKIANADAAVTYCGNYTGYSVPSVHDYTNGYLKGFTPGVDRYKGYYTRSISGTLFAEWGWTGKTQAIYSGSDWENDFYWAKEVWDNTTSYAVTSYSGAVYTNDKTAGNYLAACVSQ